VRARTQSMATAAEIRCWCAEPMADDTGLTAITVSQTAAATITVADIFCRDEHDRHLGKSCGSRLEAEAIRSTCRCWRRER